MLAVTGLVLSALALALTDHALPLASAAAASSPAAAASSPAATAPPPAIDFDRARALLEKRRAGETLTPDEEEYLQRAIEARRAGAPRQAPRPPMAPQDTSNLKPLTEMTADDRYQGEDGGLYGKGRNTPPDAHRQAAEAELARIRPLDDDGKPDADGKVVLVSISMSNATQEFSTFKRLADEDPAKSPRLTIVDCAQGGQAMAEWADPKARPWEVARERLASAGVSLQQVQVAWIKLANKMPQGTLQDHGKKLQADTLAVIQNARALFPNLRIAYLSSRIYGGYAGTPLNPEPYAYDSAFVVRWLVQDQVAGGAALNFDAARGPVKAPLLLWGPYLWANGSAPRKADGLVWLREDLAGDGTHPSESGRLKVTRLMLAFFKTDPLARPWFTGPVSPGTDGKPY